MVYVGPLAHGKLIPKGLLLEQLDREAPAFLRTLFDLDLPPATGRLRIPVVETQHKAAVQAANAVPMVEFVEAHVTLDPAARVSRSVFRAAWADADEDGDLDSREFGAAFLAAVRQVYPDWVYRRGKTPLVNGCREDAYPGLRLSHCSDVT